MEDIRFIPQQRGVLLTLSKHLKLMLYLINLICILFFTPFAFRAFQLGDTLLGALLAGFVILLGVNTICVIWRGREFFHYSIVTSCLFGALSLAVHQRGIAAVFWTFPVIVATAFVLPLRAAMLFAFALASVVSVLMFSNAPFDIALRASLSLLATIAVSFLTVTVIQDLQNSLRKSAEQDPLTGLANRRQLDDTLLAALNLHERESTSAAILLIDIDQFKSINDKLGHDVGDRIIQHVAKAVIANTRSTDMAFRLGGDEFLVLLNDTDSTTAELVSEKIRKDVEQLTDQANTKLSVSIGASVAYAGLDKASWLKHADLAMYQAKKSGRNAVCFAGQFDPYQEAT
jgi:diguanylate cyclase (GGDEF)-like protein